MNSLKITNILLLVIAIPIVILGLQALNFIFVPLAFAMFISLLFIPRLRYLKRKGVPKVIGIFLAFGFVALCGFVAFELVKLSSREILENNANFVAEFMGRIKDLDHYTSTNFGYSLLEDLAEQQEVKKDWILKNLKTITNFIIKTSPQALTCLFFVVLLLFESFDFEKLLNKTILKNRFSSVKAFNRIEKDIATFIQVKALVSIGTGIGTGLFCYAFDISFPIFWGIFAFAVNFIQMVGSFVTIIALSLFAFVELGVSNTLFYFVLSISLVQVLFGSILEPIFMGKSFSINIITVLIMLMFWGFVWGVPGMILSIPLTVSVKIILEQFPKTKALANLME